MKKKVIKSISHIGMVLCGVLLFSSCVNEEYDLSKGFNMEMTILKDVSIPVGDIQKISLADILALNENETLLKVTENGDYVFTYSGESMSGSIEVPNFNLGSSLNSDESIKSEPVIVKFPVYGFSGIGGLDYQLVYSELNSGKPLSAEMDIEIESQLPALITDVRYVELNAHLKYYFSVNAGKVYVKEGFTIIFPDNLHLTKSGNEASYEIVDGHKVVIGKDVAADYASGKPFVLDLIIERIDVPAGSISNGVISLVEHLTLDGDFYANTLDFSDIPDELNIEMYVEVTNLEVKAAEVKFDFEETAEGVEAVISDVPDFLKGDNICLDIYNPTISLDISNKSPMTFGICADIASYQKKETHRISLGSEPEISIGTMSESHYLISRREADVAAGVNNIVVPEIADLLKTIPEKIAVESVTASSTDEYVKMSAGDEYEFEIGYAINAPLAFGEALNLSYTQDIEDLGLNFDSDMKSAEISFDMVNSIPLAYNIGVEPVDSEGNIVSGITLSINTGIASGTQQNPVTTPVIINIRNTTGSINIDGLRLTLTATSPAAAHLGTALNKNQGLEIQNLILSVPDGITIGVE